MSDLDELAKAANVPQRVQPQRILPLARPRPNVMFVAAQPSQPANPFWAGFAGTYGVIAAIVLLIVVCSLVGGIYLYVDSRMQAERRAELRDEITSRRDSDAARVAAQRDMMDDSREQTRRPAYMPPVRPSYVPDRPVPSAPFQPPPLVYCSTVEAAIDLAWHLHKGVVTMHGRNRSTRKISGLHVDILDETGALVGGGDCESLTPGQTFDASVDVETVDHPVVLKTQIKVVGGKFVE